MLTSNKLNRILPVNTPISISQWSSSTYIENQAATLASTCSLDTSARPFAWPYLLTAGQADFKNEQELSTRLQLYFLLQQIVNLSTEEVSQYYSSQGAVEEWRDTARRIRTDAERVTTQPETFSLESGLRDKNIPLLRRLLETYAIADPAVGYCQGMSDLAAPVIEMYVKSSEGNQDCSNVSMGQHHPELQRGEEAQGQGSCHKMECNIFWCFWGILQHMRANFLRGMVRVKEDIAAVKMLTSNVDTRLHSHICQVGAGGFEFCFQMLLLLLRRELPWCEANMLWDSLFARHALLHHGLDRKCPKCLKWEDLMTSSQLKSPNSFPEVDNRGEELSVEQPTDKGSSTHPDILLDWREPKFAQKLGPIFKASDDMLRALSIASTTALLVQHRKSYLACNNLPEIVQLSNKLPDLGPGIGLKLASQAMSLILQDLERGTLPHGVVSVEAASCTCYGP
ncbi:hypothetical protein CEUSTIGMA_g6913.t1 [Chlamydomonas eustigma]|uniref:Rab-GAP TBC domain-containing protein n=1 Tax=Chlamydomonas eustigma TaxID=1157962 RepID=A0A250X9A4_9CHLO|nr:hypothetical protein CEUSTIGMA_g6913.t1 [Chlamydomonas eustigma]|eukprot:GAX79472.1 hypothetical protein CEUSTIGMA_g6913.t1 [Chlamydomonas eustigma]